MKRVVMVGKTGAGKSAAGNKMIGRKSFVESARATSCTTDTRLETGRWLGSGDEVEVIDSPGLADSERRDKQFVDAMVDFLKNLGGGINVFCLVMNVTNPRYDTDTQAMLKLMQHILTPDFWNYTAVVFTRCDPGGESIWEEQVEGCRELCQRIGTEFHVPAPPAFFVSTKVGEAGWDHLKVLLDGKGRFSCDALKKFQQIREKQGEEAGKNFIKELLDVALKAIPLLIPILTKCTIM